MNRPVHPSSKECMVEQLDVFDMPSTQSSVEDSYEIELKPANPLNENSEVIEFRIPADPGYYPDPESFMLMLNCQIKNSNIAIADEELVGPVSNFANALFEKIDVDINNRRVTQTMKTYPYKSFIQIMFGYKDSAKNGLLSVIPWSNLQKGDLVDDKIWPVEKRSKNFYVGTPIMCDIFMLDRFLLSNVSLDIKLYRSSGQFPIITETPSTDNKVYKVDILDAALYFRKIKVSEKILAAHFNRLNKNITAKYPMVRTEVKPFPINGNTLNCSIDTAYYGELPRRMIVCMVDEDAFNGNQYKNPFNFKHYNLRNITVTYNGKMYPSKPYMMDFTNHKTLKPFCDLYSNTGQIVEKEPSCVISRSQFEEGLTFFAFNFTPDLSDGSCGHTSLIQRGVLRIELDFGAKLPNNIVLLLYSEFDSLMEIDRDGQIHTDF